MEMESSAILAEDEYEHVNEFLFYTPTNIPGKGCDTNLFDWQISFSCSCANGCVNADTCVCIGIGNTNPKPNGSSGSGEAGVNYKNGRLVDAKLQLLSNFNSNAAAADNGGAGYLVECGSRCQCNCNKRKSKATKCENRLVQFGPSAGLQIQLFAAKGYGLASTKPLRKGQFICEYAGEVIGEKEAMERRRRAANASAAADGHNRYANANYIFTLNEFVGDRRISTIVDATCVANIGRYINHSCDPNCSVIPVRVDSLVPRLCIFSLKDIAIGEEITYKYDDSLSLPHNSLPENFNFGKLTACLCASERCMNYLPYSAYTST